MINDDNESVFMSLEDLLNLDTVDAFEAITGLKLRWYQKCWLRWWKDMKRRNPHLNAVTLFESIRKGRY